jgi:hypothetical protein
VIECGSCQGQQFRVLFISVPVAGAAQPGTRFLLLHRKGEPGGERLTPRYCLECLGCGLFLLASPDGPDPSLVRGDTRNN